ncbi:MAG: hypothetical protein K8S99_05025 [Planctomycetes bacterium]|nr:hypothetical protein [Planctomycetota bacterium]
MSLLYDIAYAIAAVASAPLWGWRLWRTGKWRTDWASRLGRCSLPSDDRPTVLIHAVSVGEVNACRLLVRRISERSNGRVRVVVCTTTDTGTARAKQLFEPDHAVVRYPLDFTRCVRRFLDAVRPGIVALAELEVWPNFVRECGRRGVPVCVVNGRLSARSFGRYKLVRPVLRPTFAKLAAAAVQTREYADRFIALGVDPARVSVTDSMKWDTADVVEADKLPGVDELARALGIDRTKPLIVAGSTGPGEEALLLRTCPESAQLLIAPRKPERFHEVAALSDTFIRRTRCPDGSTRTPDGSRLFLLDTIGDLRKAYALADVVIVGRSFLGLYGSDPMEPAALARPLVIGPRHADFRDAVEALVAGGGIVVTAEPGAEASRLLGDRPRAAELAANARRVILSRRGATDRHADLILGLLKTPVNRP